MARLEENSKDVISACTSMKLDVDGISKPYEVFKIKLNLLYYNNFNDRIASWISQYTAEHGPLDPDDEEYNDIIQRFIWDSNPQAMKKTLNNIKSVKQRVPGVVLKDGRIIDGNRRFTCLRELSKEDPEFNYFEAVILDQDYIENEKTIKALELRLQHGADKQVDYNPIDRLVGVYNDIVDKNLFTVKEYAKYTDSKESEVKKNVELAKLLVEFLEFANAPKQFHIARDMDIDGPLHEMYGGLSKISDEAVKEQAKQVMFTNLLMRPSSQPTPYLRKIKNILSDEELRAPFLDSQETMVEQLIDKISEAGPIKTYDKIVELQNDSSLREELQESVNASYSELSHKDIINEPVKQINGAKSLIDSVDSNILKKIDPAKVEEMKTVLESIEATARALREQL